MIRSNQILPLIAVAAAVAVALPAGFDSPVILAAESSDLSTLAERSGYAVTGRYDEVSVLASAFEKAFPRRVKAVSFGTSPQGRPLIALVASDDGVLDPVAARKKARPVILVQGGIHAGEIDGKDAGFALLRDVLRKDAARGALARATLVFVPVFNVDGHERFGPSQRPNQRGPAEMGFRTTAQNLNLNRDYVKAEAPEMQAMLRLLNDWDPVLYVDLHVTDGAKFRHDVAILVDPAETSDHPLQSLGRTVQRNSIADLIDAGHLPLDFYPSFRRDDDPASGFAVWSSSPRFSSSYWAWRGRLGMLVETHSWHTYAERVRATRALLVSILERAAAGDAEAWRLSIRKNDDAARAFGGGDLVVEWGPGETVRTLEFLGFAYERFPSAVSGRLAIRYDESRPEVWRVPLVTDSKAVLTVRVPSGGYVIPPEHAVWLRPKLALHGIRTVTLAAGVAGVQVESFRASEVDFAQRPFENRATVRAHGRWSIERRDLAPGSVFVPVAQPGGRLVAQLFDPQAPDSFVAWGYFNAVFEQKEYMETYVAEEMGARMLRDDPETRAEFERRLADDAKFAADPDQRLDFFRRRDRSWDIRRNLYPIVRVETSPTP